MASSAISAQGSTLQIATGTGSALTITAISQSKPMRITVSALNSVNPGDVVQIAGVVGMTQVNAASFVIDYIDATNKVLTLANTDSTGYSAYTSAGTATPTTYTKIGNVKSFSGFDGSASEIDVTNLDSTAKEFRLGLTDPGSFQIDFDQDNSDAGQVALRTSQVAGTQKAYKLTFPNGNTASFNAFCKKFSTQGGVDAVVKAQAQLRITGSVVWA